MPRLSRQFTGDMRIALHTLLTAMLSAACAVTDDAPNLDARPTPHVAPFLMFQDGRAEEAMDAYVAAFDEAEVVSLERHPPGAPGPEGKVMIGEVVLAGERVLFSDSAPVHDFDFTPSMSLFVDCESAEQLDRLAAALSADGGQFLMPPGDYGFSRRFAWLEDGYGVSWQLNLPRAD